MSSVIPKKSIQLVRKARVRKKLKLHATRPRLSIFRSNKYIYAQIIDDKSHQTLAAASSKGEKQSPRLTVETAKNVGVEIAKIAKEKNITKVCFDRGSYAYHGRLKAFADAARAGGLEF